MPVAISTIRANQVSAVGLSSGLFNGNVEATLIVVDAKKLKFKANVKYFTGDVNAPFQVFTPCTDDGEVKTFGDIDDLVKWINGAFDDVSGLTFTVDEAIAISKPFVPPLDPLADAAKQKARFTKLKAGIQDNKANALSKVAAAEAQGYDEPTAHSALQALYASLIAKRDAVLNIEAYYTAREAVYVAILAG